MTIIEWLSRASSFVNRSSEISVSRPNLLMTLMVDDGRMELESRLKKKQKPKRFYFCCPLYNQKTNLPGDVIVPPRTVTLDIEILGLRDMTMSIIKSLVRLNRQNGRKRMSFSFDLRARFSHIHERRCNRVVKGEE